MTTSVCLNPCLDRVVQIDAFLYGGMNRIRESRIDASGKAVNVGICMKRLGRPATVIGFSFPQNGQPVADRLSAENVAYDFVPRDGLLRTNLKVFDRNTRVITEFNESGDSVDEAALQRIEALVVAYAARSDFMVFTGSLPPGCDADTYARLMRAARGASPEVRLVLDAEGEKLTAGLAEAPFLIKPNRYELEMALGRPLPQVADIKLAAMEWAARYGLICAVSMGGDGALIADAKDAFFAPPLKLDVRSTVGAGDSMLSGMLDAYLAGADLSGMLALGVAAASASCQSEGTALFTRQEAEALLPRVRVHRV